MTRSAPAAGGIGFGAFVLTGILSALPGIGPYMPTGLWGPAAALALGAPQGQLVGPVLANVGLVGAALAVAWWSFRRQEL